VVVEGIDLFLKGAGGGTAWDSARLGRPLWHTRILGRTNPETLFQGRRDKKDILEKS